MLLVVQKKQIVKQKVSIVKHKLINKISLAKKSNRFLLKKLLTKNKN